MFSFFFPLKSLNFLYFFEFYVNYFFILAIFRGWVDVFWGFGWNVCGYWVGKVLAGRARTFVVLNLNVIYFYKSLILYLFTSQ